MDSELILARSLVAHALACCGGIYAAIFPDVEMNLAAARSPETHPQLIDPIEPSQVGF
jgi:hypothetical protein